MNRQLITQLLIIFITSWSLLGAPFSAYAHDDEAYIELSAMPVKPGTSITIRGSGFEPGDATTIMLISSDRSQVLGTATVDDRGSLTPQVVWLPADLIAGAYEARAADTPHLTTAELNIVTEESDEEGGQRGEGEPLPAPMPMRSASTAPAIPIASVPLADNTLAIPPPLLV